MPHDDSDDSPWHTGSVGAGLLERLFFSVYVNDSGGSDTVREPVCL
jgi:hypothetical protein